MTRVELVYILKILDRIKNADPYIAKAIAYVNKDLAQKDACKGQLRDQYEYDNRLDW